MYVASNEAWIGSDEHAAETGEDHRQRSTPPPTCGASFTPRSPARSRRSTPARISSPMRVRRSTTHSRNADVAAAAKIAIWLELIATPFIGRHTTSAGSGPSPGGEEAGRRDGQAEVEDLVADGLAPGTGASAGSATSRPMVPTMRAYTGAVAEPPSSDPVEQEPEQRREHEDRDDRRRDDGPAQPAVGGRLVELEVEVRGHERDRAVREVEDPRGLVRQDEARRHDRVDGAGDRARDHEVEESLHTVIPGAVVSAGAWF